MFSRRINPTIAQKKLYKDSKNMVFAGVAAGLADYADIDVTLMRLLVLAVVVFSGIVPGLIFYIVAAMIMPVKEENGQ